MPTVYIINKSAHDFTPAQTYGHLVYLSKGGVNKYAVCNIFRQFKDILLTSKQDDYILLTSLTVMSVVACCIFVQLHGRLNLLLFKDGVYVERTIDFNGLKEELDETQGDHTKR